MICRCKEFIDATNKIKFDFIWKGGDEVIRLALSSYYEDGELKVPHLESIIKTQRILCCKEFASDKPSAWKTILSSYLKRTGGNFILCCNFFFIKLPKFYEESLNCFLECSAASKESECYVSIDE